MALAEADSRRLSENLRCVRDTISAAAIRANRRPEDVRLVAVTKYVDHDVAAALVAAGCHDLGESRPQELWRKAEAIADQAIRWHLVGRLQRNKVRRTLPLVSLIHSVDSVRLLEAIDAEASSLGRPPAVLLEVNVAGEEAKQGFAPGELEPALDRAAALRHVAVRGLMTMAPLEGGTTVARTTFAALRELRDRLRPNCPPGITLDELSMGMSGDFAEAIAEGTTIVRVGSALFEGVGS